MNTRRLTSLFFASSLLTMSACLPKHLEKYRTEEATKLQATVPDAGPGATAIAPAKPIATPPSTIYALTNNSFRFMIAEDEVWDTALNTLLRNYNLTIVNKESGIITTEWDTYYLKKGVYRNKVSMRIRRSSRNSTDVIFHNNVEKLQDGNASNLVGALWLPADDEAGELGRIVQNMATLLNQPAPVLPAGMVATDTVRAPPSQSAQ